MGPLWQNLLVGAVVALAAAWLILDRVRRRRAGSKCDGCALAQAVMESPDRPTGKTVSR
ncbi:MAG TPA: FeoB-associated Cys-rich membrane protein [Candidatus Krumholzibacteria bacterium]|nr:FeoB-associated Cys-rich membrane protein [Candidatus Krumholzibacteria bacterium]